MQLPLSGHAMRNGRKVNFFFKQGLENSFFAFIDVPELFFFRLVTLAKRSICCNRVQDFIGSSFTFNILGKLRFPVHSFFTMSLSLHVISTHLDPIHNFVPSLLVLSLLNYNHTSPSVLSISDELVHCLFGDIYKFVESFVN